MAEQLRKKIAFFSLTSCGGCLSSTLGDEKYLAKLKKYFEIVDLRKEINPEFNNLDIAVIEGNPDSKEELELTKKVRRRSKTVIIVGACADLGGVQSIRNLLPSKLSRREKAVSVSDVIRVDYLVPGCPVTTEELASAIMDIYWGKIFRLPDLAVCFECRKNENDCLVKEGKICLGPITRAGCNSICVNNGQACLGCRGLKPSANMKKMERVFQSITKAEQTNNLLTIFGKLDE